jgi:DNA-binding XRE family transcriptional regulator
MSKDSNLQECIREMLKDEEFKKEWCIPDAIEIKFLRKIKGLTQKELAKMVGTKQEAISRLENNSESATLKFIGKVAYALGYQAKLVFKRV